MKAFVIVASLEYASGGVVSEYSGVVIAASEADAVALLRLEHDDPAYTFRVVASKPVDVAGVVDLVCTYGH